MKIKITMIYQFNAVRKATIKKTKDDKRWRKSETREHLHTVYENINGYRHYGKQHKDFCKT
jgi:hypothetical protein